MSLVAVKELGLVKEHGQRLKTGFLAILASYLTSGHISKLVTLDRALLGIGKVSHGGRNLKIVLPDSL